MPIIGWDSFFVSSIGRVKRKYISGELIMKSHKTDFGYIRIQLRLGDRIKSYFVHVLVAKSFIPNPENKGDVNHKNSIRDDNRVENLEWASRKENVVHGFTHGFASHKGTKNSRCILSESQVLEIRKSDLSCSQLAKIYPVSHHTIRSIKTRRIWQHLAK